MNTDTTNAIDQQLRRSRNLYTRTLRIPIGNGTKSVERTVAAMRAIVQHAAHHPLVHQVASTIAATNPNRNRRAQLGALYEWMRDKINFKGDTFGSEVLRHPAQIIDEIRINGKASCDCDDQTLLGGSIVRALGMRPFIRVVAKEPDEEFVHVHFGAELNAPHPHLLSLDPQERIPFGQPTPAAKSRQWWA